MRSTAKPPPLLRPPTMPDSRSVLASTPLPLHSATHQRHATLHSAALRSGSGTDGRLAGTPGSQARRSHSQPHLTVPCHPSPTNCWLLCVCPPTLLRPRSQPALRAKPSPGFPCDPSKPVLGIARKAEGATPASPLDVGFPRLVSVHLARKNAKDTGGIFLASRTLTSPPKLVWPLAVAVSRWA